MYALRKEDLSLQHYIKNKVLADYFIETESNVDLTYLSEILCQIVEVGVGFI